jgi:hypothetical protein
MYEPLGSTPISTKKKKKEEEERKGRREARKTWLFSTIKGFCGKERGERKTNHMAGH